MELDFCQTCLFVVGKEELKTSDELIAACSNPKYKAIILTAPSRRLPAAQEALLTYTAEEIAEFCAAEDFASEYYKKLYDEGNVIVLAMPVNFSSAEFAAGIVNGLTFLSAKEAPYLVHCTEGKDRAGFASMLIEALMGASMDEIIADYMMSYDNYYGVDAQEETEKYNMIVEKNAIEMLKVIAGVDSAEALASADLAKGAENYLLKNGMAAEAIEALKANLK